MQRRSRTTWVLALLMAGGTISAVFAAEQPSGQAASSTAAAPAPQILSANGTITALDITSAAPSIQLTDAAGKSWTIALDAKTTTVWQGMQLSKLEELKVGDAVKVRYINKEGKETARTIQVAPAMTHASAPSASTTTPAAKP